MRNVLVTGSSGIGGAVAAALGERAVTVGRNGMIRADLSLLRDTARAADEVTTKLSAIVCCAGVFSLRAEHTAEGMERAFVLNYLSRYLLVRRLLPLLEPGGRVVLVANAGRYRDTLGSMDDLNLRRGGWGLKISGRTQFACDLFAVELAARGVEAICVFPGPVASRVFRDARGVPAPVRWLLDAVQRRVGVDPARAAATALELTGPGFFGPRGARIPVPERVLTGRREELWAASEELVRPWLA
jgi:NAD(P)-dependent dehydrogenase (short-subunit alcohol dehydrogenase family)